MAYRIALHALEWLAVSAATVIGGAAFLGASPLILLALAIAVVCASLLRGLALRSARADQFDALLGRFRASVPGRAASDGGR